MRRAARIDYSYMDGGMPEEMISSILSYVDCASDPNGALANVCDQFRRLKRDPRACTCDLGDLIRDVLVDGKREAMLHIMHYHVSRITPELLGEMCLAVGTVGCPAKVPKASPKTKNDAQALLALACQEGKANMMRDLIHGHIGAVPTSKIVYMACERLHRVNDEGPLRALLESSGSLGACDEDDLVESLILDSDDSSSSSGGRDEDEFPVPAAHDAIAEIMTSRGLTHYLRENGLTTAFVYLLRWDSRFAGSVSNHLAALECAISQKDQAAANSLVMDCGLDLKWLSQNHVGLLAQHNWASLLDKVLDTHPYMAHQALTRAIAANAVESVEVAGRRAQLTAATALDVTQFAARRDGRDAVFNALVSTCKSVTGQIALNALLGIAWVRRWTASLATLAGVAAGEATPPRFLAVNINALLEWAIENSSLTLIQSLLQNRTLDLSERTVILLTRYLRKHSVDFPAQCASIKVELGKMERRQAFCQLAAAN